jgi:hypothetical protein
MAFVNAYLTVEEKRMFEEAEIRDPRYKIAKEYLKPDKWTIDREKNIVLINCGVADRDEYYKETFALIISHFDDVHWISATLMREYGDDCTELTEKYGAEIVKWKILDLEIPNKLKDAVDNSYVYNLLSEALSAYGVNGNPKYKLNIKAILEK